LGHWLAENPVLLEFVPPPRRLGESGLERRLDRLAALLDEFPFAAVNIPEIREENSRSSQGERSSPFEPRFGRLAIAREIRRRFGVPAVVNHVVASRPAEDLASWLRKAHEEYGVDDFVLVGPSSSDHEPIGPSVRRANEIARSVLPASTRIGNICIPGRRARGIEESARMEEKAHAGAQFFTTQILYHATPCRRLLDALASGSPAARRTPILVSLCPLRSAESISFLRWLGVELDEPTAARLSADPEHVLERSIEHLVGVWQRIRDHAGQRAIGTPLGLNIAPVGPVPLGATIELARALVPR
jgi:5,10-methylenetetrahydrofolate reductase